MAALKSWLPEAHLAAFLDTHGALNERLCVGLSGGRDSVLLLHAAAALHLEGLTALHVHHGLSPNADRWVAFCEHRCAALGIPLTVVRTSVERGQGGGLEAAARTARYRAFADYGAQTLLLAHHQDDQAETVLFNLLRGSGVSGAAGIPPVRFLGAVRILRPWLDVPGDVIARHAEGLGWVEDESNANPAFSRNFLRHEILPRLRRRFSACSRLLAQAGGHFAEADSLLGELAEIDWARCREGEAARLTTLRQLSSSRLKNLLRWRLRQLGWRVPVAARLDEFVRQLQHSAPDRHPALYLPEGCLRVSGRALHWQPGDSATPGDPAPSNLVE